MGVINMLRNKFLSKPVETDEVSIYEFLKKLFTKDNGETIYAGELLKSAATRFPGQVALISKGKSITYQELFLRSIILSKKLKNLNIVEKDKVLLLFENSIEFYVAYFAIWQVGAVCIPLNTFLHNREIASIIKDAKPKATIVSESLNGKLEEAMEKVLREDNFSFPVLNGKDFDWNLFSSDDTSRICKNFIVNILSEDELCLLLYSSGTTGTPKGIMLSSRNIMTNTMQGAARLGMYSKIKGNLGDEKALKERFFAALPLFHVFAQNTCIWFPFMVGGTIIIVSKIDRREILKGLKENPTLFFGVPALFGLLCLMKTAPLDSVKLFVSGGDAMSDKIRSAFAMVYGRKICAGYGLTEASPVIAVNIEDDETSANVVGKPLVDIKCEVRSESGRKVKCGEIGTLWTYGDNVMLGYYNSPKDSACVLQDGWLNTGDLAKVDRYDNLEIIGRSKDLIIHKGFNIYPQEIENILLMHPTVLKVAVLGKEDLTTGQVPVAFIAVSPGEKKEEDALKSFCSEHLAIYKIPRKFIYMDDLPMNPTGKIDKKQLMSGL